MGTLNVIEIPLADLARDPILPPRIIDDERIEELCRSLAEHGMAEPLLVRPAPETTATGPKYLTVLGYRRQLGAVRLNWHTVSVVVRDDLDDQGVLQLAFEAAETTEELTYLEEAWYYAAMKAVGMTQTALAAREGSSTGKASMYVRVGNAITAERIAEAGLMPEDLAALGITKLEAITHGPEDELNTRIAAAVLPAASEHKRASAFEWKEGRGGIARATFRGADVSTWSPEERVAFIESIGPILAQARSVQGLEDPAVVEARSRMEAAHRTTLIEAREERLAQVLRLTELNEKLVLALNGVHARQPVVRREDAGAGRIRQLLGVPLQRALRWFSEGSRIEGGASIVEEPAWKGDPQIRIRFEEEQAA
jgi:ParB/RepB/Spo0J family partition protein